MTPKLRSLTDASDEELLAELTRLAAGERHATAALIHALMELDARKLYLAQGYASLYSYCTRVLRLSEHAALGRIEAARCARRLPLVLDLLLDGSVTITNARLLSPHLTLENHQALLAEARHKSKREVEEIVARLRPLPDVVPSIRRLPKPGAVTDPDVFVTCDGRLRIDTTGPRVLQEPIATLAANRQTPTPATLATPGGVPQPLPARPLISPIAPGRYKVQFTISDETRKTLRRAQDLLRHAIPNGDLAAVFDRALTQLVAHLEKQKCAATLTPHSVKRPAAGTRRIPAAVRREVWARDEGRCAFAGTAGRCEERGFLEFHHVVPYAAGGDASVGNIELRCRAHNAYEADLFFGPGMVREAQPVWSALVPERVA